ncbi:hypothetical protein CAPTEDRAFT_214299 [Capitella teleta]|uniref:THAP-type domain-containing protein n=1 Tax=Capitella teleta TaxID=283909 RepID=R7VC48_CAPTE|nr:hypothetical protein CAPTEDRAFT_214299 [Capitella teleta]|eukprot:ELU16137.1 hypothetical protein CAPTEDRAFT_214299 [Capitella teleta]
MHRTGRGIGFPDKEKEKQRWEVWFQNCHRTSEPNKKTRICSVHFESSCFKQTKKNKRLTDSAVPTLFNLPNHLQKTSQPRATATSKRAAEPLSVQCVAVSADVGAADNLPLLKVQLLVLSRLGNLNVFDSVDFEDHVANTTVGLDNHYFCLIKQHHFTRLLNQRVHANNIRRKNTKTILFMGQ